MKDVFFKSLKRVREAIHNANYMPDKNRRTGRTLGQAYQIIGWCLQNPERPCVISSASIQRLKKQFEGIGVPTRFQDHAAFGGTLDERLKSEINRRLISLCKEVVIENLLEGFIFDREKDTITYSIEQGLRELQ